MKHFKGICIALSALLAFGMVGCKKNPDKESDIHGDPNANRVVPTDSVLVTIPQEGNGRTLINCGVQLDPYFTIEGYNVGRRGRTVSGKNWEVKAEDWENVVVPRMREMELSRIRMMLMPGWYAPNESNYLSHTYEWGGELMQGFFDVMDTCKELNIEANITIWGTDGRAKWLLEEGSPATTWLGIVAEDRRDDFAGVAADGIKYLIEQKGYTNISEVTLYNEPTDEFGDFGKVEGFNRYAEIVRMFDQSLKDVGIRDKIALTLSDDTQDGVWLSKTLSELEGVYDRVSSHTYNFGPEHSNEQIQETQNTYALKYFRYAMEGYEQVPHIWNEFGLGGPSFGGIDTHTVPFPDSGVRGFEIARVALNLLYGGSSGVNYWTLFNQYYDEGDRIMNMGLWRYADEDYACNPVYYSYSLFTRFCKAGAKIYPLQTEDGALMGIAFRYADGNWTYLLTNNSTTEKKISFLNETQFPTNMKRYVYDENNVPTDGKVIASDKGVVADGRVLTDVIGGRNFVCYTTMG